MSPSPSSFAPPASAAAAAAAAAPAEESCATALSAAVFAGVSFPLFSATAADEYEYEYDYEGGDDGDGAAAPLRHHHHYRAHSSLSSSSLSLLPPPLSSVGAAADTSDAASTVGDAAAVAGGQALAQAAQLSLAPSATAAAAGGPRAGLWAPPADAANGGGAVAAAAGVAAAQLGPHARIRLEIRTQGVRHLSSAVPITRAVPVATLGREKSSYVAVEDGRVSRAHARIQWRGGGVFYEDDGSTSGSKLNGQQVLRAWLRHGDVIEVGSSSLHVTVDAPGVDFSQEQEPGHAAAALAARRLLVAAGVSTSQLLNDTESIVVGLDQRVLNATEGVFAVLEASEEADGAVRPHNSRS
jgi:hypothetical protein